MRILNLKREFELLSMKEGELVKDFVSRITEIVNRLKLLGETILNQRIVEKVMLSLPEKFDSKGAAIEEARDLNTLSLKELAGSLQAYEQRIMKRLESTGEEAFHARHKYKPSFSNISRRYDVNKDKSSKSANEGFKSEQKGSFSPCGICKKTNHLEKEFWKKKQCRLCKRKGHIERYS